MNFDIGLILSKPQLYNFNYKDIKNILKTWGIYQFNARIIKKGSTRLNWLISTSKGDSYILRNVGSDLEWLNWQLAVIEKLSESGFPYSIPSPLLGNKSSYHLFYQKNYWILYPFITGKVLGFYPDVTQSFNVGVMVGEYHKAIQGLNYRNMLSYKLNIFDRSLIEERFERISKFHETSRFKDSDISLFSQNCRLFKNAYDGVAYLGWEWIKNLPKLPIHYDFHGENILNSESKIAGLIDFDALGLGSRVIDFQNALVYMSSSNKEIDLSKAMAFSKGYTSVWPLTDKEIKAIYPLTIERLVTLISQIIEKKCNEKTQLSMFLRSTLGSQDEFTRRLIYSLIWIIKNKNLFTENLYSVFEP